MQFHSILLNFSEKDQIHKGKYKNAPNAVVMKNKQGEQIVLFDPSPPHLVKGEMLEAIEWTNEQLETKSTHPLLVIANFIFEFLAIHPFKDGNGRISRALTNMMLLQAGYSYVPYVSLDEIIEETKSEYYFSLRATQKKHKTEHEDITPWVDYLLNALLEQTERARKIMEADQPEKLLSERQIQIYKLFEDDKETLDFLKDSLKAEGFVVDATEDGEDGSYKARVNAYDIVILDIGLPRKDGRQIAAG